MASRGSREVGADLLGTEQRKLLDKTFKELTENCLFPCRNLQCRERKRFKGVTDNARIPCRIRVFKNDRDITEIADETIKIPDIIFREKQEQFGHQVIPWNQRTPRQLFLYNQQILERDLEIDVLKIRCICVSCNKVVSECHAVDTKEKLHLEVKEYVAHDRNLPLLYDRQSANLDLPDDASKVCALSHGPGVNRFVDEVLPRHIEAIRASLRNGALQQRLSEKSQDARTMFQDPKKTYIRIGLGLRELGGLTAILELWPQGYRSPKHHHGGCAGSVRVLHGELHCYLYKTLLDETPMEFEHGDCGLSLPHGKHQKLMLKAPATTWLNRQNWWTHEVWCGSDNPGDFALSLHLYKSCTDEFAFVKPPANGRAVLAKGGPKNDFFWNLREEGMGLLDTDDRVKEIGQGEGGRPKNFVETVLSAHAAGPSSGSGEVSPSLGYPSQPELHQVHDGQFERVLKSGTTGFNASCRHHRLVLAQSGEGGRGRDSASVAPWRR
ncbi:unnamed protein product [Durusdinium trenchii]|uniref:Cysteine dioxygenase n=1 Tax=Durusdinium trenchii TaxID=1381693 RepID=A0ABP0LMQ8_9DINO